MQDTLKINNASYLLDHLDTMDVLPYREVSFAEDISVVFGSNARVVGSSAKVPVGDIEPNSDVISEFAGFTIVLVIVTFYMFMLMLSGRIIAPLFKSFTYKDIIDRLDGICDVNMERLLRMSDILLYIIIAYTAMVFFRPNLDTAMDGIYLFLVVLVVGAVYGFYNAMLIKVLRYISENEAFFDGLTLFNRSNGAIAAIIFLPVVMLISFADLSSINWLTICLAIMVGIFIIHYLVTLFVFFRRENVSFLEYILYLCSAEIVPISFVIIFAIRNYPS